MKRALALTFIFFLFLARCGAPGSANVPDTETPGVADSVLVQNPPAQANPSARVPLSAQFGPRAEGGNAAAPAESPKRGHGSAIFLGIVFLLAALYVGVGLRLRQIQNSRAGGR